MERKGSISDLGVLAIMPLMLAIVLSLAPMKTSTPRGINAPVTIEIDGPYFSPNGGGEAAIIKHIDTVKTSLYVLAYSFTSDGIINAVIAAKKRGADVVVVLDKSHMKEKGGAAERFKNAGIVTLIDGKHAIQHNKVMVIDGKEVVTGSYNFTKSANERNAENVFALKSVDVAAKYRTNFKLHEGHALPYNPAEAGPAEVVPEEEK